MSQDATRRAVIYLRVSSAQQAETDIDHEGFSLPAQREACERRAHTLGAEVDGEFMDRGISATSTRRPGLQAMLARLAEGGIDYVIVHKVDRLARNRADDVSIVMAIRQAGAQLVSTSENVDETPSGLLLHGIMSSIAEFYSKNLATEIIKGSTQKAKKGGTPYKAPLGYRNHREWIDGREIRTVIVDPDRGPLITRAFTLYASGEFALSDLAAILEAEGLRTNATRKLAEQRVGPNRLSTILRNDYYLGTVRYGGQSYPDGRHTPLTDVATFERVQEVLALQRHAGERSWKHHHYLVGTIFCAECGGRLIYSRNRGNTGAIYEYFFCSNRRDGTCSQPHHRVEAVEQAVEDYYATIQLSTETRADIARTARERLSTVGERSGAEVTRAERVLSQLAGEEAAHGPLRRRDLARAVLRGAAASTPRAGGSRNDHRPLGARLRDRRTRPRPGPAADRRHATHLPPRQPRTTAPVQPGHLRAHRDRPRTRRAQHPRLAVRRTPGRPATACRHGRRPGGPARSRRRRLGDGPWPGPGRRAWPRKREEPRSL